MPTASYALRPKLNIFFLPIYGEEGSRLFVACFLHTSPRYTFDLDIEPTRGQPASCRARTVNTDDHLENSMRIHPVRGERLPAASYALCSNVKNVSFLPSQRTRFFAVYFYTRAAKCCFSQTPDRRPPHITGRRVNTAVSLGWVGAPNERAPFRVHDAVIGFVDKYLTRSRIADQGVGVSHKNCAGFARAKHERVDVYV